MPKKNVKETKAKEKSTKKSPKNIQKETEVKAKENREEIEAKVKELFESYCGSDFDPAKKSDCILVCKKDNPEEFSKCEAHFKTAKKAKSRGKAKEKVKRVSRPVDMFGTRIGTSANMINQMMLEGGSLIEMAEAAETTTQRVYNHIKQHLVGRKSLDVRKFEYEDRGKIYIINDKQLVHPDAKALLKEAAKAARQ